MGVPSQGPDPSRRAWPIFLIAVLLGLAGLALFVLQGIRDYRVFHVYQPAQCRVTGYGVTASTMNAGLGRTRRPMTTFTSQYMLEYDLGGKHLTALGSDNLDGVMGDSHAFTVGQSYPCWYDPANPYDAVLVRQFRPLFYSVALVPMLFLVVGASFLAGALRPKPAITLADGGTADALAVRLAPELSRGSTLVAMTILFVLFSAALLAALAWMLQDMTRLGDWWFFLLIAIAAEAGLIRFSLGAVVAMRIPDPIIELDREPVKRGEAFRVSIRQPGPARFDVFRVSVACERQGKSSGRQSQKVLMMKKDFQADEHLPFAKVLDAAIDADAPPSDKSLQTLVTWRVVVKRTRKRLWGLDREYVFRVD